MRRQVGSTQMSDEEFLVSETLRRFELFKTHHALGLYFQKLPDESIRGQAQHLTRQYFKQLPPGTKMDSEEKEAFIGSLCAIILDNIIQKVRMPDPNSNYKERDGAELFYRRALNQISRESYPDAERLLRRAVQIHPDFADGWEVLAEVYEHNGKKNLAFQARLRLQELSKPTESE